MLTTMVISSQKNKNVFYLHCKEHFVSLLFVFSTYDLCNADTDVEKALDASWGDTCPIEPNTYQFSQSAVLPQAILLVVPVSASPCCLCKISFGVMCSPLSAVAGVPNMQFSTRSLLSAPVYLN